MLRLTKNPHLRIALDVALVLKEDIKLVHAIVKRLFYKKFYQTFPWQGHSNIFKKPGTCNKGTRYISLNKRRQHTLSESTCSRLCAESSLYEQGTEASSASKDRGNAE